MMKMKTNLTKRAAAALLSLLIVLTITTASLSAAPDPFEPNFILEPEAFAVTATVRADSNMVLGNFTLDATVRNLANVNLTNSGNFTFQWQFSPNNNTWNDSNNIPGATSPTLVRTNALTEGFYRCVVTYSDENSVIKSDPSSSTENSNSIRVSRDPNTTPYIAVIYENGLNASGNIALRAALYDRYGNPITNLTNFRFQWQFSERQEVFLDGATVPIVTYSPYAYVTELRAFATFAQNDATMSGKYRCEVTYVGSGETGGNNVFYTGEAEWSVTLHNTSLTSAITSQRGTLTSSGGSISRFNGLTITVDSNGRFSIRIINQTGMTCTYVYKFRLYNVENGVRVEPPLEIPIGGNFADVPGRRLADPVPVGFATAGGSGASDPIPIGIAANGTHGYVLEYNLTRRVPDNQADNHSWNAIGTINFATQADLHSSTVTEISESKTSYVDLDGAGESLDVDYPTYNINRTGSDGAIQVQLQHPAHRVFYEPNGGFPVNSSQNNIRRGIDYTVADNAFVLTDHVFTGWNTAADGSGHSFEAGELVNSLGTAATGKNSLLMFEELKLYAQWSQDLIRIDFNPGEGTVTPEFVNILKGGTLGTQMPIPELDNHIFIGWFTMDGIERLADTVLNEPAILYARWQLNVFEIIFDPGIGEGDAFSFSVESGDMFTLGEENFFSPPYDNYRFSGWLDEESGITYNAGQEINNVTKEMKFTAQWAPKPELSFTDSAGNSRMDFILLPADSDDGKILESENINVYFIIDYVSEDDIEFRYYDPIENDYVYITSEVFVYNIDDDVWYFTLNRERVENILNELKESGQEQKIIIEAWIGGDLEHIEEIIIRRIGLFNLH
jgi:hypothetical protein